VDLYESTPGKKLPLSLDSQKHIKLQYFHNNPEQVNLVFKLNQSIFSLEWSCINSIYERNPDCFYKFYPLNDGTGAYFSEMKGFTGDEKYDSLGFS
jgi:hypothetical protein